MSDNPAPFRELHGVGPATEARLHAAGVDTWEALSEILTALSRVRGVATDTLRAMTEQATDLASEAQPASDAGPSGADVDEAATAHHTTLDAGRTIGGRQRPIHVAVSTAHDDVAFAYAATLRARPYGATAATDWTTVAQATGRTTPPEPIDVRGDAAGLPSGLHRLRLDVDVMLAAPRTTAPRLQVT